VQHVELTEEGVALFDRLREVARRHDQMLRSQLSDDDVAQLGELLAGLEAGVQAEVR
jgi:DNA-binding MarR family transcriptional regulator